MKIWLSGTSETRMLSIVFAIACAVLLTPSSPDAQFDLCGCASLPGLQPFDSANAATFPPGTSDNGSTVTIPLPADGVLKFSSFRVTNRSLNFAGNAANTRPRSSSPGT